ncbi:MAG: hypothetical protein LQ343_007102 [Gyalolechia ehrenbergii]|nr:MAG: hypothetical protein LQ343_007102 [Gyalolechia ehrenbergii]
MERKLNVIAFISGGKDSFFSLLHCIANGHRITALANLYPPNIGEQAELDGDLNSHMYQTVGHSLVPLYADMLSLPLYRQEIRGKAVNQAKEYHVFGKVMPQSNAANSTVDEDETESMMDLLRRIKMEHSEANAVCAGAILSTYQRTRIESVALRMQLIPLAYLWQYPELPTSEPGDDSLLKDMAAVGLDARIIKVASGGLDEDLLWENVCAPVTRKRIAKAMKRFGGSVLGEGGEFETLVVNGPLPIFRAAIQVQEEQRKVIRGDADEAWTAFTGGTVVDKDGEQTGVADWLEKLRRPDLLDETFNELLKAANDEDFHRREENAGVPIIRRSRDNFERRDQYHIHTGKWTSRISNISASYVGSDTDAQIERIKIGLLAIMEGVVHRSVHDIVFTTILLRSMDDFHTVNQRYAELFASKPNPPARVTIACGDNMPQDVNVVISVVVALDSDPFRRCLHIQSRSYWAPANIGPYSQAVSVPLDSNSVGALVYIAGQIPLVPASMDIVTQAMLFDDATSKSKLADFRLQTTLSLQHLWRVGKAMNVGWWIGAVAFVVANDEDIRHKASITALVWEAIHTQKYNARLKGPKTAANDADFDVWDHQRDNSRNFGTEHENDSLPDFAYLSLFNADDPKPQPDHGVVPPFFAAQVAQLPRNSEIEWQALGVSQAPTKFVETVSDHGNSITACTVASDGIVFGYVGIKVMDTMTNINGQVEQSLHLLQRRCNLVNAANGHKTIYTSCEVDCIKVKAQLIPCISIWSFRGEELAAAIVLHYEVGDASQRVEAGDSFFGKAS